MCTKLPTYESHIAEQVQALCKLGAKHKRAVEIILGTWFRIQRSGENALDDYLRRKILIPRGDVLVGALYLVNPNKNSPCLGLLSVRKRIEIVPDDVWLRGLFLAEALASHEARVLQRLASSAQD
jgi:hypothetical protein